MVRRISAKDLYKGSIPLSGSMKKSKLIRKIIKLQQKNIRLKKEKEDLERIHTNSYIHSRTILSNYMGREYDPSISLGKILKDFIKFIGNEND